MRSIPFTPSQRRIATRIMGLATLLLAACTHAQTYPAIEGFPQAQTDAFIERMKTHHFSAEETQALLQQAEHKQAIIDAMTRPAERTLKWYEYRRIFMKPQRIEGGAAFWNTYQEALSRAEQTFGVPAEYIVAIIGVETRFGTYTGKWRVLDALTTLGFNYPKRGAFFTDELEHYMLMTREQALDPLALKGSYAGAMGYGQFISSSYRNYAIDFDGDNKADLWNPVDAIGSIANYFVEHGWQAGQATILSAKVAGSAWQPYLSKHGKPAVSWSQLKQLGVSLNEGWLADDENVSLLEFNLEDSKTYKVPLNNFYVITRYNHSKLYALAVHELAVAIKQKQYE